MNRIVKVGIPFFALAVAASAKPIPAELFGQNIEHTRSALQGGLSAQLVRNRKFAGKPSRAGVAMMWEPYGAHAVYDHANMFLHASRREKPDVAAERAAQPGDRRAAVVRPARGD